LENPRQNIVYPYLLSYIPTKRIHIVANRILSQ